MFQEFYQEYRQNDSLDPGQAWRFCKGYQQTTLTGSWEPQMPSLEKNAVDLILYCIYYVVQVIMIKSTDHNVHDPWWDVD